MSKVKENARKILAAEVSLRTGIPLEAADDLLDHIQGLLYDHRGGIGTYPSEQAILTEFGISPTNLWVFD